MSAWLPDAASEDDLLAAVDHGFTLISAEIATREQWQRAISDVLRASIPAVERPRWANPATRID